MFLILVSMHFLTHGFFWSLGSYFARDASYSCQYSPPSTDHNSRFVAQVLVRDFVQGKQVYLCPPTRPGISNRLLDSCVGNRKNPSIFVVFEKHQIYPACVLEHTRKDDVRGNNILSENNTLRFHSFELYVACKNLVSDIQLYCSSVSVTGVKLQVW